MIYQALVTDPAARKPYQSWWAVHAETLTPVRIDATQFPHFFLEVIAPPENETPGFSSHPEIAFDPKAIAREVTQSIRQHFHPKAIIQSRRLIPRAKAKVPEYLILFDGEGEHPAIFRSTDPHLIIPAIPQNESTLGQPLYWRTTADLSVEGWAYWWEDCQRAWDELTPAFIQGVNPETLKC